MNRVRFLSHLPLFRGLPERELETLSGIAVEKHFRRGETLFLEGAVALGFFVIFSGKVKVYRLSPEGREIILHIVGPGDSFAEVPVFEGRHYPASSEAIEASRVLVFPREELAKAISKDPSLAMNMLAALSGRLREFARKIEELSLRDVPSRLSAYLLHLSEKARGADELELDIKKGLLASLLGTKGESLSRILAKMSARRILDVRGKKIRILDRKKLKDIAAGSSSFFE